ncbi:MAG: hypothetical protein LBS44_06275 [Deltaproteobacteria bacterium]|nr:hypothetical protein [Deltaproteobacteria bacterium]
MLTSIKKANITAMVNIVRLSIKRTPHPKGLLVWVVDVPVYNTTGLGRNWSGTRLVWDTTGLGQIDP